MRKPTQLDHLKKRRTPTAAAVVWYTEQEWARVKAAAQDPEVFENTYAEWMAMATDALADIRKAGVVPVKVNLVADELFAWCLAHGRPVNASARSEFVLECAQRGAQSDET